MCCKWPDGGAGSLKGRPIYGAAIADIKKEGILRRRCRHRPVQCLNNILEQDHRAIKRRVNAKQIRLDCVGPFRKDPDPCLFRVDDEHHVCGEGVKDGFSSS